MFQRRTIQPGCSLCLRVFVVYLRELPRKNMTATRWSRIFTEKPERIDENLWKSVQSVAENAVLYGQNDFRQTPDHSLFCVIREIYGSSSCFVYKNVTVKILPE